MSRLNSNSVVKINSLDSIFEIKATKEYIDGFNPHWVEQAFFDGIMEIPKIERPKKIYIPEQIVPFTCRNKTDGKESVVCFYEKDKTFADFINNPDKYIGELNKFNGIITADPSLYIDMPLCLQIADVYFNRAVGCFMQSKGMYVIPNIRWGDERTYTTCVLPEKIAFLGAPKHSIVSIGTYGQIKSREDKFYFREGLIAMLDELKPKIVLVYGAMPKYIFEGLENRTHFVDYPDWITLKKRGGF